MVKFYTRMVKTGKMTLEDVPEKWRTGVEEELNKLNTNNEAADDAAFS